MSGAISDASGDITDQATATTLVADQAADSGVTTHVGTFSANLPFAYNGATMSFLAGVPFIADAGLYAAINASSTAAAAVTWTD